MIFSNLFPVFAIIAIGWLLKRRGIIEAAFLQTSDRLVYYLFFPAMLFWKIGGVGTKPLVNFDFVQAVLLAVAILYILSLIFIRLAGVPASKAGSFSQCCYRFNTYIGMAVAFTAYGEEGVRQLGVLIGFAIPVINLLAVSTLIWYSSRQITLRRRLVLTVQSVVTNPLIIACMAGGIYANVADGFPPFADNFLRLLTMVALPMALISIGGSLNFDGLRGNLKWSLAATVFKQLVFPLVGWLLLQWFAVPPQTMRIGMLFCCLPTSTAAYVLSSQLGSDTETASAAILVSTLCALLSMTVALAMF